MAERRQEEEEEEGRAGGETDREGVAEREARAGGDPHPAKWRRGVSAGPLPSWEGRLWSQPGSNLSTHLRRRRAAGSPGLLPEGARLGLASFRLRRLPRPPLPPPPRTVPRRLKVLAAGSPGSCERESERARGREKESEEAGAEHDGTCSPEGRGWGGHALSPRRGGGGQVRSGR